MLINTQRVDTIATDAVYVIYFICKHTFPYLIDNAK